MWILRCHAMSALLLCIWAFLWNLIIAKMRTGIWSEAEIIILFLGSLINYATQVGCCHSSALGNLEEFFVVIGVLPTHILSLFKSGAYCTLLAWWSVRFNLHLNSNLLETPTSDCIWIADHFRLLSGSSCALIVALWECQPHFKRSDSSRRKLCSYPQR